MADTHETDKLVEHMQSQCNRYTNGQCSSRACLVRGGWNAGPPDYSIATCPEHEISIRFASLEEEVAALREERDALLQRPLDLAKMDSIDEGMPDKMLAYYWCEQAREARASLEEREPVLSKRIYDFIAEREQHAAAIRSKSNQHANGIIETLALLRTALSAGVSP